MAQDTVLESIRTRLAQMQQQKKKQNLTWRAPKDGESSIRIVPYKHAPDPFNELYFHYNLGDAGYVLCPKMTAAFGEACPFCEYTDALLKGEKTEDKLAIYKKIKSKARFYVPIIVRGKEADGIRFWGISKKTLDYIAKLFLSPDYGDLSDPHAGRDLKVTVPAPSQDNIYGQPVVLPAGSPSSLSQDSAQAAKWIKECPSVFEAFQKKSYEELKQVLTTFVKSAPAPQKQNGSGSEEVESVDDFVKNLGQ